MSKANNLMTKTLEKRFQKFPLYSQDGKGEDAEVVVKYFTPDANCTWLITEGEPLKDGDWEFFGLCHIHEWEYGYVRLSDLKSVRGAFGLPVERDLYSHGTIKELKH